MHILCFPHFETELLFKLRSRSRAIREVIGDDSGNWVMIISYITKEEKKDGIFSKACQYIKI